MLPSYPDRKLTRALQDESEPIESTFELNDTLYARANIPATEEVYIWLGVRTATGVSPRNSMLTVAGQCYAFIPHRRGRSVA